MRIRTSNLLIRSQMLYPIELRALFPFQEPQQCRGDRSILEHRPRVKTKFHIFYKILISLLISRHFAPIYALFSTFFEKRLELPHLHLYNAHVPTARWVTR